MIAIASASRGSARPARRLRARLIASGRADRGRTTMAYDYSSESELLELPNPSNSRTASCGCAPDPAIARHHQPGRARGAMQEQALRLVSDAADRRPGDVSRRIVAAQRQRGACASSSAAAGCASLAPENPVGTTGGSPTADQVKGVTAPRRPRLSPNRRGHRGAAYHAAPRLITAPRGADAGAPLRVQPRRQYIVTLVSFAVCFLASRRRPRGMICILYFAFGLRCCSSPSSRRTART